MSNIIARRASQVARYEPFPFIVWSSVFSVLPFFGLALWLDGADTVLHQLQGLDLTAVLAVLDLALLATLLAYSLWTRLLQRHPASKVTPFSLLVPVVAIVSSVLLLDEALPIWKIQAMALLMSGLAVIALWPKLRALRMNRSV